jgi:hypothetical protein
LAEHAAFEDQAAGGRLLAFADDERVALDRTAREWERAERCQIGFSKSGALRPGAERVFDGRFGQVLGIPTRVIVV